MKKLKILILLSSLIQPVLSQAIQVDTIDYNNKSEYKPDPKVWSYNPDDGEVYFFDTKVYRVATETMTYFKSDSSLHMTTRQHETSSIPWSTTLYHLTESLSSGYLDTVIQGRTSDRERFEADKLSDATCKRDCQFRYSLIEGYLRNVSRIQDMVYKGVQKWTYKANGRFSEWTLTEPFYDAKFLLSKTTPDTYDIDNMREACSNSSAGFYFPRMEAVYDSLKNRIDDIEAISATHQDEIGPMTTALNRLGDVYDPLPIIGHKGGWKAFAKTVFDDSQHPAVRTNPDGWLRELALEEIIAMRTTPHIVINQPLPPTTKPKVSKAPKPSKIKVSKITE